jgi:hypothetical protein
LLFNIIDLLKFSAHTGYIPDKGSRSLYDVDYYSHYPVRCVLHFEKQKFCSAGKAADQFGNPEKTICNGRNLQRTIPIDA